MTEFERIKAMDVCDLAIYINKSQNQAIDDYEKGFFQKVLLRICPYLKARRKYLLILIKKLVWMRKLTG